MRVRTVYLISLYSIGSISAAHCRGESVQKETLSKSKGPMTWRGQAHPGRRGSGGRALPHLLARERGGFGRPLSFQKDAFAQNDISNLFYRLSGNASSTFLARLARVHCLSINAASMCGPIKLMRVSSPASIGRRMNCTIVLCVHRQLFDSGSERSARRPVIARLQSS
jgi:hypothetical protein